MSKKEDPCRDPASEERDDWAENAPVTPAVKERPILFSGAMVRAILDGSKTQTRRIVKLPTSKALEFRWDTNPWVWCLEFSRITPP